MMEYNQTVNALNQFVLGYIDSKNTSGISPHNNVTGQNEIVANMYALEITRFAVPKIILPMLSTISFLVNAISICVLTYTSMVSSTNCNLTALSVFDTLYIIYFILYILFRFTLRLRHYFDAVVFQLWYPFGKVMTYACSNISDLSPCVTP